MMSFSLKIKLILHELASHIYDECDATKRYNTHHDKII